MKDMRGLLRLAAAAALAAFCSLKPSFADGVSTIGQDNNGNDAIRYMLVDEQCTQHVGTVSGTGVSVQEDCGLRGGLHVTTWTFSSLSVATTDATTAGAHGSQKIYTFPVAAITSLGCSMNLTTTAGSGGISDTAALVGALGTVTTVTDNATLTTTEADLINSYAGTLVGGVGVLQKYGALVATPYDGTTTAEDVWLNIAIPDAGSSASDTVTISGTASCAWLYTPDPTP